MPAASAAATAGWFVYMLECAGGRLYTGIALDVAARYAQHCRGRGAAFTRINPPLRIVAAMPVPDRSQALKAEAALKKRSRHDKLAWARQWPWHAPPA